MMGTRQDGSYWGLVLFGFLATGCSSARDSCETVCQWLERCTPAGTCTDADVDKCVDEYDRVDDACQDALDDYADCLHDQTECEQATRICPPPTCTQP